MNGNLQDRKWYSKEDMVIARNNNQHMAIGLTR